MVGGWMYIDKTVSWDVVLVVVVVVVVKRPSRDEEMGKYYRGKGFGVKYDMAW
jgi:hypothetical protein